MNKKTQEPVTVIRQGDMEKVIDPNTETVSYRPAPPSPVIVELEQRFAFQEQQNAELLEALKAALWLLRKYCHLDPNKDDSIFFRELSALIAKAEGK